MRKNFRDWRKLCDFLRLSCCQRQQILKRPKFTLNLPLRLANKIKKSTLNDPILKQFLPLKEETGAHPGFISDPVGELAYRTENNSLVHKYRGRILLLASSVCSMHCRFCFRKCFPYYSGKTDFSNEIALISRDTSLNEVVLSGGDPLSLPNKLLDSLLTKLSAIPHIKSLRFHTRFPVGIPERIDDEFLQTVLKTGKRVLFVIHCNHPLELDAEVLLRLNRLQRSGILILSQTVLLKGVNDNLETLRNLFSRLMEHNIIPYYLHQLDKIEGAAHFEVDIEHGLKLIKDLREWLPGYAVPRYVKEVTGAKAKIPVIELQAVTIPE